MNAKELLYSYNFGSDIIKNAWNIKLLSTNIKYLSEAIDLTLSYIEITHKTEKNN